MGCQWGSRREVYSARQWDFARHHSWRVPHLVQLNTLPQEAEAAQLSAAHCTTMCPIPPAGRHNDTKTICNNASRAVSPAQAIALLAATEDT